MPEPDRDAPDDLVRTTREDWIAELRGTLGVIGILVIVLALGWLALIGRV